MREKGKILLILFLMVVSLGILVGCQSKEPVDPDSFKENANSLGYETEDLTQDLNSQSASILNCLVIDKDDLHVEYFQLDSKDTASTLFEANKQIVEGYKGESSAEATESNSTYQKYTLTADDMYFIVEQVDNTLIYAYTEQDKSKELDELVKNLGY